MYKSYKEAFLRDRVLSRETKVSSNFLSGLNLQLVTAKNLDIEKQAKTVEKKRFRNPVFLVKHYMTYSSVHGMRYIVDPKLYIIERIVWLIFVVISISLTAQIISSVSAEFRAAPTQVVIETTSYKVSSLPFPSVTICPRDKVDWQKVLKIEKELIPSNDSNGIQIFRKLMTRMSSLSFARFDELSFLKNVSLIGLQGINITDVLLNVVPSCEDILTSCWWRYDDKDCCKIFQLQKTEHGFCYSFNSATSEKKNFNFGEIVRTSGFGDRSGLKVTLHLGNITAPPHDFTELTNGEKITKKQKMQDLLRGATLFVQRPIIWPSGGQAIATGMSFSVNVKCTSGYATQDVLDLSPKKIPCRHTRNNTYSQGNCISHCRLAHVIKYCGCNPSYYFRRGVTRDCNVKDFLCLIKYNDIFINLLPGENTDKNYMEKGQPVMICDCPPPCDYFSYETNMVAIPIDQTNDMILDVHFDGPTSIRYRTEVVFTTQDMIISFGGIFCLFVGGSLFSIIELIYTCFLALLGCFYLFLNFFKSRQKKKKEELFTRTHYRIDFK